MRYIPRIIHYCWFGGSEKTSDIKEYIETWRTHLPEYEIMEWSENNFCIEEAPTYVRQAYSAKKYAFVSDYVRIKALSEYGGVYFDTDLEVLRNFDELLENRRIVLGFESEKLLITAFIAVEKNHTFINEFLKTYEMRAFIDENENMDMTPINDHFSAHAIKYGIDINVNKYQEISGETVVYPIEYFCGFDVKNWHVAITENTYTVHHMNSSWASGKKKLYFGVITTLQKILGYRGYDILKRLYDKLK